MKATCFINAKCIQYISRPYNYVRYFLTCSIIYIRIFLSLSFFFFFPFPPSPQQTKERQRLSFLSLHIGAGEISFERVHTGQCTIVRVVNVGCNSVRRNTRMRIPLLRVRAINARGLRCARINTNTIITGVTFERKWRGDEQGNSRISTDTFSSPI